MSKTNKNKKMKEYKTALTALIAPLVCLVLGFIMIISPQKVGAALCYILGASLTVYGLFNIISFFTNRDMNMYFEMVIGVISAAFGIFTLFSPQIIVNIIFTIIGIVIIIDSLIDIKHSFELRVLGLGHWWISFILSVAVIILGISTVFFPSFFGEFIMVVLGIILVYQGISGLVMTILIGRYTKKVNSKTNMIDAEATDID